MQLVTGDYLLAIYILLIVPAMFIGRIFARRRMYVPQHKYTMTALVMLNWLFIIFVMVRTYSAAVEPNLSSGLTRANVFIPTLHGIFGLVAQLLATYLVIRMWFENQLPEWIKVKHIKRYMITLLVMWFLTITLGILTWAVVDHGFLKPPGAQASGKPVATAQATVDATVEATPNATPEATTQATSPATAVATAVSTMATPQATVQATAQATAQATVAATK